MLYSHVITPNIQTTKRTIHSTQFSSSERLGVCYILMQLPPISKLLNALFTLHNSPLEIEDSTIPIKQ